MDKPSIAESGAKGQVPLIPERSISKLLAFVARGKHETESRSKGGERFFVEVSLVTIVQEDVADAVLPMARVFHDAIRNGVTELVFLAEHGPFLRKRKIEPALRGVGEAVYTIRSDKNVLNDAGLLVVSLFNEK